MTNIIGLHGQPTPDNTTPVASVVDALEEMLAAARAGYLIGAGVITVDRDKTFGYHLTGFISGYAALGAAEMLKSEICMAIMESQG